MGGQAVHCRLLSHFWPIGQSQMPIFTPGVLAEQPPTVFLSNRSQDEHLFHLFFSAPASAHYSIFSHYLISSLSRSPKLVHAALRNFYSVINQPPYILSLFAISLFLLQPSPASMIPLKLSQEMHIPQGQRTCRLIRFAVPWYHFKALFKIPVLRRTSSSILSSWLKTQA